MGGKGVAKRLEADRPEERAKGWATLNRGSFPCLASSGTKTRSHGQWGCHLKELPLYQPQVSRSQTEEGLSVLFCFKATGAKANYIFNSGRGLHMHTSQTDFSEFVFLTHWKPHGSEKIHLTCWGLLSRNVSSDCCVNTATLSKLPSQWDGVICQGKNTTQTGGGGRGWELCIVQRDGGLPIGQGASPITQLSLTLPKAIDASPLGSLFPERAASVCLAADCPTLEARVGRGCEKGGCGLGPRSLLGFSDTLCQEAALLMRKGGWHLGDGLRQTPCCYILAVSLKRGCEFPPFGDFPRTVGEDGVGRKGWWRC